jgi:hypothetical protein
MMASMGGVMEILEKDKSYRILSTEEARDLVPLYFILKNLVLWARSEINGSALEFCV